MSMEKFLRWKIFVKIYFYRNHIITIGIFAIALFAISKVSKNIPRKQTSPYSKWEHVT